MRITKLDNSAIVVTVDHTAVAIDIGKDVPECDVTGLAVDALIVSHLHADHQHLPHAAKLGVPVFAAADAVAAHEGAGLNVTALIPGSTVQIGALTITAHEVDHGTISFPIVNLAFDITSGDKRIWFAGDIAVDSTRHPSGTFDAILVPVGGGKVFEPEQAVEYAQRFSAAVVIPMHFDTAAHALVRFCKLAETVGIPVAALGAREQLDLALAGAL